MSWLKTSTKVREERNKKLEEEQRLKENEATQVKQELREKLAKSSSLAIQSLEAWTKLDCDRIITDVQKNLLGGNLGQLHLEIRYPVSAFATKINVSKNQNEWLFQTWFTPQFSSRGEPVSIESERLDDVLFKIGFNPERHEPIRIKRFIYERVSRWRQGGETDYEWEEDSPIFTLEIDHPKVYCDGKIIGTLAEIGTPHNLEERLDEILASRLSR